MPQPEGSSSSTTGRVGAQIGTAAAVAAFVLGAGWGTTATLAISVAGANDQRGVVQVTSTFTDGAYAVKPPFASAWCNSSTSALTDQLVLACSWTTTVLTMTFPILPVAAKVYLISYLIVP